MHDGRLLLFTHERAAQHLRDEADYPKDSPWRYNDVAAYDADEE